ncbi:PEP-CTERM sorting domain-containing protein [Verrucomicrobiaceae bacterium N1E253]|uniref:PEP-CTERM sorting domain-containing protein n=1 Tax=Oceaniferula marina TaxID=2748318 RepID=A0A851GJ72_9BACT|nr:PEP-CTERM sorting domain-containing protein [Oceaniferula marina]NWK55235.1 PEP-CTERM sorting domain-containing protein [Oceaniferula marina]
MKKHCTSTTTSSTARHSKVKLYGSLLSLTCLWSLPQLEAATTYTYDFESLNGSGFLSTNNYGTLLNGQDGWINESGASTSLRVRSGDASFGGNNSLLANSTSTSTRQNNAGFSYLIADSSSFTLSIDVRAGTSRFSRFGLTDSFNKLLFGFGVTGGQWSFTDLNGTTTSGTSVGSASTYKNLLASVDLAANGGNGAISISLADIGSESGTAIAGLQNINMNLGTINGSDMTGLYASMGGFGGMDNISITAVPEPSSATLLGLSGLALILRRKR